MDWTALQNDLKALPKDERDAAKTAICRIMGRRKVPGPTAMAAVIRIIEATARGARRRRVDRAGDAARRVLIGARVRRDRAEVYRNAAARRRQSLYAWTVAALDAAAAQNDEGGPWSGRS